MRASCTHRSLTNDRKRNARMLNRSKLAAVGLLAAVFVAGGLAGWGGREAVAHDGRGPGGGRGPDAMGAYLSRGLGVSSAQRGSVRASFARRRPQTACLWARAL